MMYYYPDCWAVVKIKYDDELIYKVLAGWYGGFAGADSWKLNSGITNITDNDDHYLIEGHSGSVYVCHKQQERLSGLTASILKSLKQQNAMVELVTIEEVTMKVRAV